MLEYCSEHGQARTSLIIWRKQEWSKEVADDISCHFRINDLCRTTATVLLHQGQLCGDWWEMRQSTTLMAAMPSWLTSGTRNQSCLSEGGDWDSFFLSVLLCGHIFFFFFFQPIPLPVCLKPSSSPGDCLVTAKKWGWNSSLVVFGLAVHSVAGSILLWWNFLVEGIFPLELTWVQTPFPPKLFRMRV